MAKLLLKEEIVKIPADCIVTRNNNIFTFSGPLGEQTFDVTPFKFTFIMEDGRILIKSWHGNRKKNNLLYTVGSHLRNNANGVVKGFKFVLKALYNHFSIQLVVADQGKSITVKNYLGNKIPKVFPVLGKSTASIGDDKDILIIQGINLNDVSQSAANIINDCRKKKKYDPRVFLDGIFTIERATLVE
ncbi:ribosomal prt L9 [Nucleospora cyclopteri]